MEEILPSMTFSSRANATLIWFDSVSTLSPWLSWLAPAIFRAAYVMNTFSYFTSYRRKLRILFPCFVDCWPTKHWHCYCRVSWSTTFDLTEFMCGLPAINFWTDNGLKQLTSKDRHMCNMKLKTPRVTNQIIFLCATVTSLLTCGCPTPAPILIVLISPAKRWIEIQNATSSNGMTRKRRNQQDQPG